MRLADIVKRNRDLSASRTALVFEGRSFTYGEYTERCYRLANALLSAGLASQDRVAVLAQNCNEYLEIYGACEVAGLIIVPLNHRLTVHELATIWTDCGPRIVFAQPDFGDHAEHLAGGSGARIVRLGDEYEALLASADASEPAADPRPDDTAYLIYTSGTTGRPKGVMLSQRAVAAAACSLALDGGAKAADRMLICMPFFHIGGRIELLAFAVLGATVVLHRSFDEDAILHSIERERVTAAHLAPTMIGRLLDWPDLARHDLSSLGNVHYASAPMPVPLLRRAIAALGPIFAQVYGMTECIVCSVLKPHQHVLDGDAAASRRLASAGQPFLGCAIRIVDSGDRDRPRGEIGEILVRSPALMTGYWNNHAASIATIGDGWMRTGDLGTMDDEGFLAIVDRKKDMIISGGENIYSWEVEEALRTHPGVADVAVVGVPDPVWGESVRAFVVRRDGRDLPAEDLVAHCRERIASYKKPRSIVFVEELPRMFHGKIDKKALRAQPATPTDERRDTQ